MLFSLLKRIFSKLVKPSKTTTTTTTKQNSHLSSHWLGPVIDQAWLTFCWPVATTVANSRGFSLCLFQQGLPFAAFHCQQ